MNKYIIVDYDYTSCHFYSLYKGKVATTDYFYIKEILVDNSEGRLIFSKCNDKKYFYWRWKYMEEYFGGRVFYSKYYKNKFFKTINKKIYPIAIIEANNNEEAILYFKLNY